MTKTHITKDTHQAKPISESGGCVPVGDLVIDTSGVPILGHCAACYGGATILEFGLTLCIRCAKEWKHGNGTPLVELSKKYAK